MADPHPDRPGATRGGARTTQRRGRMSLGKREALAELAPRWLLPAGPAWSDRSLSEAFGRSAPRLLDVGVGSGTATRAWALERPDHDVLVVELHQPGIVALARALEADGPATVRVVEADVTALVAAAEPATFRHVRILFPDPWPKRRHVGRRLVEPRFVQQVTDLLAPGGSLHLATDWVGYADQMRASLATEPRLRAEVDVVDDPPEPDPEAAPGISGPGPRWRSDRPDRPVTAYEARGIDAGRAITDLVARRVG